ncbi:MAG: biotin transporter BioY [Geminicoccaceae bacterium]|nr:biotin transporter BioY [Geminicoccaceae bacterium]
MADLSSFGSPPAAGARHRWLIAGGIALIGSLLLTVSAKTQIPFYPVPMTLQTMVVLLLGMMLGARLALLTVLVYLAEGAFGLPVFAGTPEKGLGLAYMTGPTGGYLVGFALTAWLTGRLTEERDDAQHLALAALLGIILIYGLGVLWLTTFVGAERAIALGIAPFIFGDLLKAALAVALGLLGATRLRRWLPV